MIHEPIMKLPTNIITFSKLALVDDDYDDICFQYSLESPPLQSTTATESTTSPCNNNMCFRGGNKMMDQSLLLNVMMSNHELNYDDAACSTTVCNSSLDDDESTTTSDVSSYLTSMEVSSCHDDTTPTYSSAEEEDEDDMSYLCQQLSHSSSYYTALSSEQTQEVDGDEGGDQHPDSSKTLLPSLELVQRIDALLSKERYADYSITNYFEQQQNDDEISDDEEDDDDEYSAPIDYECRVKMMDWSYRVLSYRFPYNDQHDNNERSSSHHIHQGSRRRKHSIQAIQIVSQSFSLVDRYATHYYYNHKRSMRKVMDRNEYKLICMICLHIAAKTSGYFGLYNERGDEFYDDDQSLNEDDDTSNCNTASSDYASLSESESAHIHPPIHHRHHQEMRTENEDDSCCYYLSSQESTFSSLSLSSSVSDDDNDCDTTGCNSQSNDGATDQTIVKSTPDTLSCSSNNSSANDRSTRTTHHPANNTKSSSVAISKQQHKSHKRQRRRPSLSLLSLPGLVLLSANEYTIEQLTSIELHVLQTLQWKGIGGTSSTSCTVLNWLWLLLDVIKDAAIGEEDILINNIRECSLINAESVMEDTLCEKRTPCSLFAMASIIHALNEEGYCCNMKDTLAGSYRRVLFDILPHKEKEVDHVIQLYFFGS